MIEVPMIEVSPLPAWKGVTTQWRAANGSQGRTGNTARSTRRWRVAWSPSEAADLAGVPVRTVHSWAKGSTPICDPRFVAPNLGIDKPRYCAGDVLRLRIVYDLREHGLSTHVARLVADDVDGLYRVFTEGPEDLGSFAAYPALDGGPRMIVPADDETADFLQATGGVVYVTCPIALADAEDPDHRLLEYPLARRLGELAARADLWWRKVGVPPAKRPPWLT